MNLPVLGAWLHNIGVFAQRAGLEHSLSGHQHIPADKNALGPARQQTACSDYFIGHILPLPDELEGCRSMLADLAASPRKGGETSREQQAIRRASRLAAGRDSPESEDEDDFGSARLNSIFATVRLGGKGPARELVQYRLKPLGDDDAIFPTAKAAGSRADYTSLWQEFVSSLRDIPCKAGVAAWQATLVSLLERYCWCIPSSARLPDVSLHDHCAATAAITQALLGCAPDEEKFLLFGGDLSGIQAFIFGREEPADSGATRLLRARSFLLQAVTRSVWLSLLGRLKLDPAAKIMDAGGRFVLLLPDSPEVRQQLDKLELEAEVWLLEKFQGTVRLNFARLPIVGTDLEREKFAGKFDQFNQDLEEAKLHPFSRAFAAGHLPMLPVTYEDYGKFGECAFCHTKPAIAEEDGKPVCEQCRQLKKLGRALPATRFVAFTTSPQSGANVFANLLFDGIRLHFYENRPPDEDAREALQILSIRDEPLFTTAPVAGHIPLVSTQDMLRWEEDGRLSRRDGTAVFMGEQCVAGAPKTFAMLAQEARIPPARPGDPWTSLACLGVCKADVDNLGLIFGMGFGSNFSLSCYAMLARMLNHFFAGYLMRLIRREFANIYVVFAGGDDVFVIGPWAEIIEFGLRMAGDFRKFCGNNPAITISAGLPLIRPGLPMRAMKEEAEEWLEASKNHRDSGKGAKVPGGPGNSAPAAKNAATIFGVSAHWEEAEKLLDMGKWLAGMCNDGMISRGFLRRLLGYARECGEFVKGRNMARSGLYLSHFRYDLARNWKDMAAGHDSRRESAVDCGQADKNKLELQKLANDEKLFPKAEMGISWAIYRTRISA